MVSVTVLKDPISALTHFIGFLLAAVGLGMLASLTDADLPKQLVMVGYGGSLTVLFGASAAYHFFDIGHRGNRWLQRVDHSAIFLLIAGTYAPPLLHLLDGTWRIAMYIAVFGLASVGILLKMLWIDCPSWLSLGLYLGLGWIVLIPARIMLPLLDWSQLILLASGGVAYTAGAVIFALERPNPWPGHFGHHEVWHLFVLAGAAAHFGFVWSFVGLDYPPF